MTWSRLSLTPLLTAALLATPVADAQQQQSRRIPSPDLLSADSLSKLSDLAADSVAADSAADLNQVVFPDPTYKNLAQRLPECKSGARKPTKAQLDAVAARVSQYKDADAVDRIFAKQPANSTDRMCYFSVIVAAFKL